MYHCSSDNYPHLDISLGNITSPNGTFAVFAGGAAGDLFELTGKVALGGIPLKSGRACGRLVR